MFQDNCIFCFEKFSDQNILKDHQKRYCLQRPLFKSSSSSSSSSYEITQSFDMTGTFLNHIGNLKMMLEFTPFHNNKGITLTNFENQPLIRFVNSRGKRIDSKKMFFE